MGDCQNARWINWKKKKLWKLQFQASFTMLLNKPTWGFLIVTRDWVQLVRSLLGRQVFLESGNPIRKGPKPHDLYVTRRDKAKFFSSFLHSGWLNVEIGISGLGQIFPKVGSVSRFGFTSKNLPHKDCPTCPFNIISSVALPRHKKVTHSYFKIKARPTNIKWNAKCFFPILGPSLWPILTLN